MGVNFSGAAVNLRCGQPSAEPGTPMGQTTEGWDAFVSYERHDSDADEEAKHEIVRVLSANGLKVWHDGKLEGRSNTFGEIYPALEQSRVVVGVFSPAYMIAPFCSGETFVGFGRGRMIPVLMPGTAADHFSFREYQGITYLRYGGAKEMAAIVDAVKHFGMTRIAPPRAWFFRPGFPPSRFARHI